MTGGKARYVFRISFKYSPKILFVQPITDKSIVKDVLVLRAPTCGTDALTEAFRKQVAVLQQIVTAETNDLSLIPPNVCIV